MNLEFQRKEIDVKLKRLTVRNDKNNMACCPKWIFCAPRCEDCDHFKNMMNKLADYKDLDEHGNVIRDGDEHKLFANIIIYKEDMQEMINEKFQEFFVDINRLIDDFVKKCKESVDKITGCVPIEFIEGIAEDLKKEWKYNEETDED